MLCFAKLRCALEDLRFRNLSAKVRVFLLITKSFHGKFSYCILSVFGVTSCLGRREVKS